MKKNFTKISAFAALICLLVLSNCNLGQPEWELDVSAPLLTARLQTSNLSPGIIEASDSSLIIVQQEDLYEIGADTLLKIPDTTMKKTVTLQSLTLGSRVIKRNITLGEVARNAGTAGQYIIASHGSSAVIPPFSNLSSGDVEVNANSFFQTATFINGKLEVKIYNGFPIHLTDVEYELRNKSDGTVLVNYTIALLPIGATNTQTFSLAGKTVEGDMIAQIKNMSSPGSGGNPVPIDTSDALEITLRVYDMEVQSATAIFPAQDVARDSTDITYQLGDVRLTRMKIKEGFIRVNTISTIQDSLYITYGIPGALLNGNPLNIIRAMPPAPAGSSVNISADYDVAGYWVDLRGQYGNKFNTFFQKLVVRLDSTGTLVPISRNDSVYIFYGLLDVVPEYAEGYLGRETFKLGPETVAFDFLNSFPANADATLDIENLKVNLVISNGVGAPGEVTIKKLVARNKRTGRQLTLTGAVVNQQIKINPATDNPFTPAVTAIELNKENSNILDLLAIFPDEITYEAEININPQGNTMAYNDFIYAGSQIKAGLDIEMPLSFQNSQITFTDTVEFESFDSRETAKIQSAKLILKAENKFPLQGNATIYVLDKLGNIIDSIFTSPNQIIEAGIINSQGRVTQAATTRLTHLIPPEKIHILQQASKAIVKFTVATAPANQYVKIYSSYFLDLKLTTDITYLRSDG